MKKKHPSKKKKFSERNVTHFLFTLPNLLAYSFFTVIPVFAGIYYSMTDWNGISREYSFIGLKNYMDALASQRFRSSFWFSLGYAVMLVICIVFLSTVLALLLNNKVRGQSFFKTIYFFPAVLCMISVGLIFDKIFYFGFPEIGNLLGIEAFTHNILSSNKTAVFGILMVNVWKSCSIPTVLVLSGLQTVPAELLESANLDGAGRFQQFRHITLPFILPTLSVVLVLALKEGLMIYDYVLVLTGGGPAGATESITMTLYRMGFEDMKYSLAIAMSIIVALVIIILSFIQIKITNRKRVYE